MESRERQAGQASVELVAVLPALLLCTLIAIQLAIVGYGLWASASAARVGARAAYVGGDAEAAARSAVPAGLRRRMDVSDGDAVEVSLRAPSLIPGVGAIPVRAEAGLDREGPGGG